MAIPIPDCRDIVSRALAEDIGSGDITSQFTIPLDLISIAVIVAKEKGIVCGLPIVEEVFRQIDPTLKLQFFLAEGAQIAPGDRLCEISGFAQSILSGERVALNFLQRLSGISTKTNRYVELISGCKARIIDTRKTTPGLRILEKYAVRVGGGYNHRFGLYDALMIKDNHILACGSITKAVELALSQAPHVMTVTVECDNLDQVREAVEAGADMVLLDNMSLSELEQAMLLVDGNAGTEASGGVNESTVREIALTGVDVISVGAITHSVPSLDISLDFSSV